MTIYLIVGILVVGGGVAFIAALLSAQPGTDAGSRQERMTSTETARYAAQLDLDIAKNRLAKAAMRVADAKRRVTHGSEALRSYYQLELEDARQELEAAAEALRAARQKASAAEEYYHQAWRVEAYA